jgi:hypothetical protein
MSKEKVCGTQVYTVLVEYTEEFGLNILGTGKRYLKFLQKLKRKWEGKNIAYIEGKK